MKLRLFFIYVVILANVDFVAACEPCADYFNLEGTIQAADVIVVGEKISEGPHTDPRPEGLGGPEWIEVNVQQVLKGQVQEKNIRVNSWQAMCLYGIQLEKGMHVIFLSNPQNSPAYDAVNYGCSLKALSIEDDMVLYEGKQIPLSNLKRMISEVKYE